MSNPNIIGGSRTIWSAAIVVACMLLVAGIGILIGVHSRQTEASAGLLVGASCFFERISDVR